MENTKVESNDKELEIIEEEIDVKISGNMLKHHCQYLLFVCRI